VSFVPAFKIGVWNSWVLIIPYLFVNFGLSSFFVRKKSAFWTFPSYTRLERIYLLIWYVIFGGLSIYSVFLPLAVGTVWFFTGLSVYLLGLAIITIAILAFITTNVDKPNTTGLYRISRHPMCLGILLVYIGIGLASASWVYLLLALMCLATYRNAFAIPEERMCCERFSNAYREYMNRTPRWIGIPKR